MSPDKALFTTLTRDAFRRVRSLLSHGAQAAQETPANIGHTLYDGTDPVRFRALERCSARAIAGGESGSTFMAIAEIDRFSLLRRQIGHKLANRLITHLVEKLQSSSAGYELGRVGRTSIEFAFIAPSIATADERLKALLTVLESEIDVDGYRFHLPVVIGAAEVVMGRFDEELIDRAAAAVTDAIESHRKVKVSGQDIGSAETCLNQLDLMRDLRLAMADDGLELHYQPKLRARTNRIESVEALLRWTHAEYGPVPAAQLVKVAEASGAIRDLSRWVIDRAIADHSKLLEHGFDVVIHLNLSGALVADTEFCTWAVGRLTESKGTFGFEITETAVIDDPESAFGNLKLFCDAGIKIAIDDYGSGLSSLAYLKQLPADELKIDRMFISSLTDSHRDPLLVRSTIDLAHALEMDVTAEGVADPMTFSLLRVMGCDLIQGYLVSHALPVDALKTFLAQNADGTTEWGLPAGANEWDLAAAATTMARNQG